MKIKKKKINKKIYIKKKKKKTSSLFIYFFFLTPGHNTLSWATSVLLSGWFVLQVSKLHNEILPAEAEVKVASGSRLRLYRETPGSECVEQDDCQVLAMSTE